MIYILTPIAWILCSYLAMRLHNRYYSVTYLRDFIWCILIAPIAVLILSMRNLEDVVVWRKK